MTATFVKRDEPRAGEITVRITDDAGIILGEVIVPAGVSLDGTAAGADHDEGLGVHQALASAIEIAETHDLPIGIVDEQGLWREEWGDLHLG